MIALIGKAQRQLLIIHKKCNPSIQLLSIADVDFA